MKNYFTHLLLLLSVLIFSASSCEKDKEPDLVPITTTGENTMGFYVDGIPHNKKGVSSFGSPTGVNWWRYSDGKIELAGAGGVPKSYLRISCFKKSNINNYIISNLSQNNGWGEFIDDAPLGGNEYYTNESVTGTLKILRLDENIISGTFDIRLQDPSTNKIIHLTDGRFDIKR